MYLGRCFPCVCELLNTRGKYYVLCALYFLSNFTFDLNLLSLDCLKFCFHSSRIALKVVFDDQNRIRLLILNSFMLI
jgi:hypothetical protein